MASDRKSDLAALSQSILRYAHGGAARIEFLAGISEALSRFLDFDAIEIWVRNPAIAYRWEFALRPLPSSRFSVLDDEPVSRVEPLERFCRAAILDGRPRWRANLDDRSYRSVALSPFTVDEQTAGVLAIKWTARGRMNRATAGSYAPVAQVLGLAIANRRAQWALRERVKELTCLYEIGRIAQESGVSARDALQRIVELLPAAWQFPAIAHARITLDEASFVTPGFRESQCGQASTIEVKGARRGRVEVVYTDARPEFAEGPFLAEERHLIDTVAREISLIVARREAEEYEAKLQGQLRHADRLATIGQLAAGVAHELNEPVGSILGFAQLMQKDPQVTEASARDLERIVSASLHAREVIRKLLVFSRQKAPVKALVDLNGIVRDGLSFLDSRCARAGIAIRSELNSDLPEIKADASQLHQVLVNLVVNSIQAMPHGGEIRIRTRKDREFVCLSVEDTGIGMSADVKEKIFTPFFTTKDVDEGTGLGLAVVHGIVTSHGGTIRVDSAPGQGTRIEVRIPVDANGKAALR